MTNLTKSFVAINYISCSPEYIDRFEELFGSRAGAIDLMPGFHNMHVLRPAATGEPYLIVSYWENEASFKAWTGSPEFLEGHKRGFADLAAAKVAGKPAPMHSSFKTYNVISE
jgi:heme-degrading monooxygenase HmoA